MGAPIARAALRSLGALPEPAIRKLLLTLFRGRWAAFEEAARLPERAQELRLLEILSRGASTAFGEAHSFASLRDVEAYRKSVPIRSWDELAPWVDRMLSGEKRVLVPEDVFFYATSSGTTGPRKLIPITPSFIREFRATSKIWARTLIDVVPGIVRGEVLTMHSPEIEELGEGVRAGSITAVFSSGLNHADSPIDAVPAAVFRVEDFASRYFLCLRFALTRPVTLVAAINPSTVLLFATTFQERWEELADAIETRRLGERLELSDPVRVALEARIRSAPEVAARIRESARRHEGRPRLGEVLPQLRALCCWKGGNAAWYLKQLGEHYGSLPIIDYGYAATEGNFGAPLGAEDSSIVLVPDAHFLEFMPEDGVEACREGREPTRLLHELEIGRRYFVVVTNGAGLYRYDINDVVEVVGFHHRAPKIVFRHKGGTMSSVTGEKLGESHVARAMQRAIASVSSAPVGFVLAPVLPSGGDVPPYYLLAVELAPRDGMDLDRLASDFDLALREENEEYDRKRSSLRLGALRGVLVEAGAFRDQRARKVGRGAPDAHVKTPHLSPDGALLVELGLSRTHPELVAQLPFNQR